MKASVYYGPKDIRWENVPDAAIGAPHEVLVKVRTSSICGSDLHVYRGAVAGIMTPGVSRTGHELLGEVLDVGRDVTRLKRGDRISMGYSCSCGSCAMCNLGMTAHCSTTNKAVYGFGAAFGDLNGTHAEAMVLPHAQAHAHLLSDDFPEEGGPLLSCNLPTAVIADRMTAVGQGETIAFVGAGPTGLMALDVVLRRNPKKIAVFDPLAHRRAAAAKRGAEVFDPNAPDSVQAAYALTGGIGFDKVVEMVGFPESLKTALSLARPGGTVAALGVFPDQVAPMPLAELALKDIRLNFEGFANVYPAMEAAIRLIDSGAIDPRRYFSRSLPMSAIGEAYKTFADAQDGTFKILLRL